MRLGPKSFIKNALKRALLFEKELKRLKFIAFDLSIYGEK
jgi:hypothetical protein